MTNSLLVCVTNTGPALTSSVSNATYSTDAGVFVSVGAGAHYLAANSPYRGAGSTNINAALRANLQGRTTYPPILYSNTIDRGSLTLGR